MTTAEFAVDLADGQTWAINFYECAAEGDLECLEEILDSGRVGVNDVDVDGFTALMVAAAEGHQQVVKALLNRGADVAVRTHELRSTALHFAAKNGDAEIVRALCECDKAVVDCWNVNADTPLIWACIEGRAAAVEVLLEFGADVEMLNQYGASTLLCAVMIGEDPEQDAESDKKRAEIVKMLLQKNSELVNFQDREGSTAMHLAASCGYLECVKTLLAFGADITLRNAIGQTPLEEAQASELRESGPCVEHLRGMWRQLEEEAAARMMAMLEMEEEAGKTATGSAPSSGKKSKKKNKKAKRKAAKQKQQQEQKQEVEQPATDASNKQPTQAEPENPVEKEKHADAVANPPVENEDEASSDDDEDALRDSYVSTSQDHSDDEVDTPETENVNGDDTPTDAATASGAWTTVGKKHRSSVAVISIPPSESVDSPPKEQPTPARRKSAAGSPAQPSQQARRKFNSRPANDPTRTRARVGQKSSLSAPVRKQSIPARASRPKEERWEEANGLHPAGRTPRSASLLNPNASAFRSMAPPSGAAPSLESSISPFSSPLSWHPSVTSSASMTTPLSSASLHYSAVGRLAWKQHQRANGSPQLAREARERWVGKLRLRNENVAETLGYLACGLCGELVNDNLQCSGGAANTTDHKAPCTQLYCASCLESAVFQTADSTVFKCVRCHEVIAKDSMAHNSFAQAQAASLGLSNAAGGAPDESERYSLEGMQHLLEGSEPRAAAVDLSAFHLVPGTDLSVLSNGQLEVLEHAHQRALSEIMEQRLINARVLERLQMEEWLKMQRDVLQYAPR